jgi:hypothetical protein
MKIKKLMIGAVITAAVALAQGPPPGFPPGPPGGFGFERRGPGGPGMGPGGLFNPRSKVAGSPYSATQTTQTSQTLADGTQISRSETSTLYRDSQGRVRTETTMVRPGGAGGTSGATAQARTIVSIFDPVEGSISRLDTEHMTVDKTMLNTGDSTRRPPPPQGAGRRGGPEARQAQTQDLGTRTIEGLTVTGTRTTMTIPAGTFGNSKAIQSVREVWTSADLHEPVLVTTSDPRFGTTTTQLTNVTRSEPDSALFVAPSNYTVKVHSRPAGPPR